MDYEAKLNALVGRIKRAYLYAQTDSTKSVLEDILESAKYDKIAFNMETIKGFVARDKDGQLCIFYGDKPHRGGCDRWWHPEHCPTGDWMNLPEEMFPELKWEDEPMEVELIIKKA